jgi:uncharacterized protein YeaO (DUF488 family)
VKSGFQVSMGHAYDEPRPDDGERVLVDRLWPRGLAKARAALDSWCKQVAPSAELRIWYGHAPERFAEFTQRYQAELADAEHADAVTGLIDITRRRPLLLLTATKTLDISHAAVLVRAITTQRAESPT